MTERPPFLSRLGSTVRALRKARGWSRRACAEQTGISERFLADIETGQGNPSVLRLHDLATALGTTLPALLASAEHTGDAPASRVAIGLLGLRGAGKSAVGRRLADRLALPFVELDAHIEDDVGLTLNEMFQMHGEAYYRRAEAATLRRLLATGRPMVIATGGGLVTSPTTFGDLREHAHTVWLRARPEDHWTRVVEQGDTRPMENNERAFADLCAILAERERLYGQADLCVDTSGRDVEAVTDQLALHFAFLVGDRAR